MTIDRSTAEILSAAIAAALRGEPIVVREDVWLKSKDALGKLNLTHPHYLKWLAEEGHVRRRPIDKKSYEYHPQDVGNAAEAIKNKSIRLPKMNSAVGK